MFCVTGHGECRRTWNVLHGSNVYGVFVELLMRLSVAVNVLPRLGIGERKLIRHKAHDRSVLVVELLDLEWPSAPMQTPYWQDGRDLAEQRAWILG